MAFHLLAGTHYLRFALREDGTCLDKIRLTWLSSQPLRSDAGELGGASTANLTLHESDLKNPTHWVNSFQPSHANAAATLSMDQLRPVIQQSIALWGAPELSGVNVVIQDLGAEYLGLAATQLNTIFIDVNAAGYGWSALGGRMDLLTVVAHEMGHLLGLPDMDPGSSHGHVMTGTLPLTVRRLPGLGQVDVSPAYAGVSGGNSTSVAQGTGSLQTLVIDTTQRGQAGRALATAGTPDLLSVDPALSRELGRVAVRGVVKEDLDDELTYGEYVECADDLFAQLAQGLSQP
jgi:hypothetical protein